jgi:multidrug efflux pump subunit AcrB
MAAVCRFIRNRPTPRGPQRRLPQSGGGLAQYTAIRLQDVAQVVDGVEDQNNLGLFNGQPAIVVILRSQAGANVIETVDSVRAQLPLLQAQLPSDVKIEVASIAPIRSAPRCMKSRSRW